MPLLLFGEFSEVVYITYTMATRDLPDIYALARGPQWYNYYINGAGPEVARIMTEHKQYAIMAQKVANPLRHEQHPSTQGFQKRCILTYCNF